MRKLLGSYSDSFAIAIGLWPVASFVFTLPILAYLYHRDGRLRFGAAMAAYLSVLYALGLACFTLYPLPQGDAGPGITYGVPPQLVPFQAIIDVTKDGLPALFQVVANIVLFVPLGFIAGRFLRMRPVPTLLLGFVVSLLIETAQLTGLFGIYEYAYRTFDVDDLIDNTLGTAIGFGVATLVGRVLPSCPVPEPVTNRPGFVRRAVALWMDLMLLWVAVVLILILAQLAVSLIGWAGFWDASLPGGRSPESVLLGVLSLVAFVVIEVAIPWMHDGSTPGGAFVRMTFETKPRTGWCRVAFYVVRLAVLGCALAVPLIAIPVLLIFYAVKRQMPYDLLP